MSRDRRYDLVILGGGTGGLVSAFVAAGMGARVALVERDRAPGGDCLWTGCVPSKSLLAAAAIAHDVGRAGEFGLQASVAAVDLGAVMAQIREIQARIAPHDSAARLEAAGVTVVHAAGRLEAGSVLVAGDRRLRYRKAIVATGSAPMLPDVPGLAAAAPLTTDSVWELTVLPERLVVLGGGPIGCELGQAFARLGSDVTIVESADRLLPHEDPAASRLLTDALRGEGLTVRTDARAARVEANTDAGAAGAVVTLEGGERLAPATLLVATGRRPRTGGLGLAAAGVQTGASGAIVVDSALRTTARHVFAVGDVTGGPAFTHAAAHQARTATVNALVGLRRRADTALIPRVTFTDPEVAHVGLTAAQARERWGERAVISAVEGHGQLDRALTARAQTAAATLVADPKRRLVGGTIVGPAAGESIAELTAWITAGERIAAVSETVHAYPTFTEAAARAADEHLRARYAAPRVRALLRVLLAGARLVPRRR
ncbi:Mercuric reductase [Paraconexibacter sp. AEG42_29]|uniref:Mercuric reductase n=1 Tax=Paraconexibacter sp. AEG42_29 TaxID=2997339 RepID=A0AAU7AZ64_9ACTN